MKQKQQTARFRKELSRFKAELAEQDAELAELAGLVDEDDLENVDPQSLAAAEKQFDALVTTPAPTQKIDSLGIPAFAVRA